MKKDYYKILNVDKKATKDEIKKAYRTLVKKYHPDVNTDHDAEAKIKDVNEAYDVLSDDAKREKYDSGSTNNHQQFNGGGFDPFNSFFGGRQTQATQTVIHSCSLKDLYFNKKVKISFERKIFNGAGKKPCPKCKGTGFLSYKEENNNLGFAYGEMCDMCFGKAHFIDYKTEKVTMDCVLTTENIVLRRMGNQMENGVFADVIVKLQVNNESNITLVDQAGNLNTQIKVSIIDYLLGGEVIINHFDGDIKMKYKSDGKLTQIYRIPDRGLYSGNRRANLFAEVIPELPKNISDSEKDILKELGKSENFNGRSQTP